MYQWHFRHVMFGAYHTGHLQAKVSEQFTCSNRTRRNKAARRPPLYRIIYDLLSCKVPTVALGLDLVILRSVEYVLQAVMCTAATSETRTRPSHESSGGLADGSFV